MKSSPNLASFGRFYPIRGFSFPKKPKLRDLQSEGTLFVVENSIVNKSLYKIHITIIINLWTRLPLCPPLPCPERAMR